MKITAERDALVDLIHPALRALGSRSVLPVLAGVRIEASDTVVEVAGTDLEVFVRTEGDATVVQPGVAVVSGRLLNDVLRSLPGGAVVIDARRDRVTIRSRDVEFGLTAISAEDFPAPPEAIAGPTCQLAAGALAHALGRVVPAASTDLSRPILTGVLWALGGETLRLVATDSYRLAVDEVLVKEGPGTGEMIVPARMLSEFARVLGKLRSEDLVTVTIGEHQAALEAGPVRIVTRLIEGRYPDWRQLISSTANVLVIDREVLTQALDRMALLARANIPVRVEVGEGGLRLSAKATGLGEGSESVEIVRYDGEPMTIGFNPQLLIDGLEALSDAHARIGFIDPARPALVSEDSSAFTYLVMPMRLWTETPR